VLSHDFVFWCGDFNYRINMSRDEAKAAVEAGDLTELLAADQLRIEQGARNVFQGFQVWISRQLSKIVAQAMLYG
jgi:phosphatidylinositol-bisphosphatase